MCVCSCVCGGWRSSAPGGCWAWRLGGVLAPCILLPTGPLPACALAPAAARAPCLLAPACSPDYSDLIDRIQWARQNDAAAKGMAASAARLVNERLRRADWSCYLYRLLLEYGALYRGEVPGGLRVPDPPSPPPPAVDRDGNPLPNFFGW